jgi:hypothetical protein
MRILLGLAATASLALSTAASAVTIAGLANTGAGFALGTNGTDANWRLFTTSPAFVSGTNGVFPVQTNWLADTATSRWITPTNRAGADLDPVSDGLYTYSLTFDLSGFQPGTASFNGRFAADNRVTGIRLNGAALATNGGGGFRSWTNFASGNGNFRAGANVLSFNVTNTGQRNGNPSGLRVEFLSSDVTAVPEPETWAMLIAGFGFVGFAARRRRTLVAA